MFRKLQRLAIAVALSVGVTSATILTGSMLVATPAEAGNIRNAADKVVGKIGNKVRSAIASAKAGHAVNKSPIQVDQITVNGKEQLINGQ